MNIIEIFTNNSSLKIDFEISTDVSFDFEMSIDISSTILLTSITSLFSCKVFVCEYNIHYHVNARVHLTTL